MHATETGLTPRQIIAELSRSSHGDLRQYVPVGTRALTQDPQFFAHLIAWNAVKGQIRDSRIALPVIALAGSYDESEEPLKENALAHIAALDPRSLVKAVRFQKSLPGRYHRATRRLVERYLRHRERSTRVWERVVLQHRASMRELYALLHIKPAPWANEILFKNKHTASGPLAAVRDLKNMDATTAAWAIREHKLPFLVIQGALGPKLKDENLLRELIQAMTPSELVTNMKMLEKLGVKTTASLRGTLEEKLKQVADSKKVSFKTSRAAKALAESVEAGEDDVLVKRLRNVQEKQIEKLGTIEGNWLVLGDASGSMQRAIESARHVAGTLARLVSGQVHLVFFDYTPRAFDVTGKTYEEITRLTQYVQAGGATSIGCGLEWARLKGLQIDGIAIVSDGLENTAPFFASVYSIHYADSAPPVYFYKYTDPLPGFSDKPLEDSCNRAGIDVQTFDVHNMDYYALPNLVQTMRANKYSLVDEILETPLMKLSDVFES